jgi:hypothetical protein
MPQISACDVMNFGFLSFIAAAVPEHIIHGSEETETPYLFVTMRS